jgi:hypothetical protein
MATVRFSGTLKSEIIQNAKEGWDIRIKKHVIDNPLDTTGWADKIYDILVPADVQSKLMGLPKEWKKEQGKFRFKGFSGAPEYKGQSLGAIPTHYNDSYFEIRLSFTHPRPIPVKDYDSSNEEDDMSILTGDTSIPWDDSRFTWLRDEYEKLCKPVYDILQAKEEYVEAIRKLVDSSGTLNKALKKCEGIWDLLPEETKRRHKEITPSYTPEPIEDTTQGIDFDKITAETVANKLIK